ncbi:hypothetical protein Nmel_008612 [Mimus melanotis]
MRLLLASFGITGTGTKDPKWDVNRMAGRQKLEESQEWIAKGIEKAIPKSINWSALYAIKQGPFESPSEFLDRLRHNAS